MQLTAAAHSCPASHPQLIRDVSWTQQGLEDGSPKVHVGHFASLTLGGGSSMLVSQSMIPPMSADAEWRQSLRIRPPAFRL